MATTPTTTVRTTPTATPASTEQVRRLAQVVRRDQAAQSNSNTSFTANIGLLRTRLDNVEPVVANHETRLTAVEKGTSGFSIVGFLVGFLLGAVAAILAMSVNRGRKAHTTVKGVLVSFQQRGYPAGFGAILLVLVVALICGYAFSVAFHKKPKTQPPPPPAA